MIDSGVMGAILKRVDGGRWPVGWVQVTGLPEHGVSRLCDEIAAWAGSQAAVINTTGDGFSSVDGSTMFDVAGSEAMSLLGTLLQTRLFCVYLVRWWDAVGPADEAWGNHWERSRWLSEQVAELRQPIHASGATVVVASCSERGGGKLFQASLELKLVVRPSHEFGGLAVSVTGRAARPAMLPFVVRDLNVGRGGDSECQTP